LTRSSVTAEGDVSTDDRRRVGPQGLYDRGELVRSFGLLRDSAVRLYAPGATPIQRLNALENAASAS
jgi:hypothetical protein